MADVFAVGETGGDYLEAVEDGDTGRVDLTLFLEDGPRTITVDGGDLARALMTASPSFAKGLGEIAQRAILSVLSRDDSE